MLGVTSLLKRQPLKQNVIDRDKIVVPSNWDSWSKIRVLGGTFDAELVSKGWSEDIKLPLGSSPHTVESLEEAKKRAQEQDEGQKSQQDSTIARYEDWCREPSTGGLPTTVENAMISDGGVVGLESEDTQAFLEKQSKVLEAMKVKASEQIPNEAATGSASSRLDKSKTSGVSEHIGPVQFNMGGIQVDADDMLQRIKVGSRIYSRLLLTSFGFGILYLALT